MQSAPKPEFDDKAQRPANQGALVDKASTPVVKVIYPNQPTQRSQ